MNGELESKGTQEKLFGLEKIKTPRKADEIHTRIVRKMDVNQPRYGKAEVEVVDGFEDIVGGPLGEGFFFNTQGVGYQLAFALAVASNPAIDEILGDTALIHAGDTISALREKQVLVGLKVIDLGCGTGAHLPLALHSLGALSYGADADELRSDRTAHLSGYIQTDLNDNKTVEDIIRVSGGNFDVVTENILGGVPGSYVKEVRPERIIQISAPLLKSGGYLYMPARTRPGVWKKPL